MVYQSAIYNSNENLEAAINKLKELGIAERAITISYAKMHSMSMFPEDYDPIGGARFAGTNLTYSDPNLVGNSVTMDVNLGMFPELLAEIVETEETGETANQQSLLNVRTDLDLTDLFLETGGKQVGSVNFC